MWRLVIEMSAIDLRLHKHFISCTFKCNCTIEPFWLILWLLSCPSRLRKVRGVQINDAVNVLVKATGRKLCSAFAGLTQHQIMKASYNKVLLTCSVAAALSNTWWTRCTTTWLPIPEHTDDEYKNFQRPRPIYWQVSRRLVEPLRNNTGTQSIAVQWLPPFVIRIWKMCGSDRGTKVDFPAWCLVVRPSR